MTESAVADTRAATRVLVLVVTVWGLAVAVVAARGGFAALWMPLIAAIVAATIALPVLWYAASPSLRAAIETIGHRRIVLFHTWRIPAALLFFWYGAHGALPTAFWVLAGTGDLIAGSYAAWLVTQSESPRRYRSFHLFGFADFVVAVGAGLTFTLLQDPRMAPVAVLPLALVPLFGVGISGASHLMAFDMLRRRVGFARTTPPVAAINT